MERMRLVLVMAEESYMRSLLLQEFKSEPQRRPFGFAQGRHLRLRTGQAPFARRARRTNSIEWLGYWVIELL